MFSCVFVTFPWDVLGHVWSLIVSIPDLSLLTKFVSHRRYQCSQTERMGDVSHRRAIDGSCESEALSVFSNRKNGRCESQALSVFTNRKDGNL